MLEKLDVLKNIVSCIDEKGLAKPVAGADCICAINDIIDVINALIEENKTLKIPDPDKIECRNFDKFAEQRKWIGCVCRFWYDNPDDTVLDYLGKIQTGKDGIEYYGKETYDWFPHCEPVKPTDSIIYQGE